jgi:hypothetical protein
VALIFQQKIFVVKFNYSKNVLIPRHLGNVSLTSFSSF